MFNDGRFKNFKEVKQWDKNKVLASTHKKWLFQVIILRKKN